MPLGLEMVGRAVMRRARRGLYAGKEVKFGNKVSEDGGNKSRRMWKPNVQYKRVYSHALDGLIRLRMSTHAMRCIDKAGGIDEYLVRTPDADLNSDIGVVWKRQIEATRHHQQLTPGELLLQQLRLEQRERQQQQEQVREGQGLAVVDGAGKQNTAAL